MHPDPNLVIQSLIRQITDQAVRIAFLEAALGQAEQEAQVTAEEPTTEENVG